MVLHKYVLTRLSAEKDRFEVAFVAGSSNNNFITLQTPENAVLSVADSSDRTCTASCTEKLSVSSLQRGVRSGSWDSSSSFDRSSL